ncbi:MAG: DUF1631 domain-containing protein [Burkholderiales bacterium]|nr:DUF1631 domain-containing protein [Burkholderiales bacterium]
MSSAPPPPLHPLLDAAAQRVRYALRTAVERTVQSLNLAAMTALGAQRDALLAAQFELGRKRVPFEQAFDRAFDEQIRGTGATRSATQPQAWEALTLVEDRELEIKVQAERFALEITHGLEWELRELEAYVGSLLGDARAERERNPLRPESIGHGVIRAIDAIADRPEVRKVLEAELHRSLATVLRETYADIVADLRKAGVQPVSLTVRTQEAAGGHSRAAPLDSRAAGLGGGAGSDSLRGGPGAGPGGGLAGARAHTSSGMGGLGSRSGPGTLGGGAFGSGMRAGGGTPIGQVDPGMMDLLRRLAQVEPAGFDTSGWSHSGDDGGAVAPNLIHANREQLRQASRGALDHMVIDVIASLFDQILSDPKVPPQLARQIARLQLPVLRAALGDPSFFSTRKHPVRQFVNRIASLGNGFEDFGDEQAQTFLAKVRDLVQEIVKGDFDQIETYSVRLAALEAFVAEQARRAVDAQHAGATALLQQREQSLRLSQHYEQRLDQELQPLAAPAFVRDFVSRVWSRVILKAAEREGVTSERVRALRQTGRELFMSVQPKATPAQRQAFMAELPKMVQQINEGLNMIGWPEERRRRFFGELMPAHAEALKSIAGSVLDHNLLARQVEQALERLMPSAAELPPASAAAPLDAALAESAFSSDEAAQIGLVQESRFDWDGTVDIDLSAEPEVKAADLALPGLPAPVEAPEPAGGRSLADHVQIGFSYQMHIDGTWQKVRLAHISPARSFFVFTHGHRHQRTISLTQRMLVRLCESGRMRAFESAELLERATARARRQLAVLGSGSAR